jgi:hypothetical protein
MPKPHFLKWKDAPEEMRQAHLLKVYSNGRGWTTDPPTEAGVYWIRVREEFEKEYEIIIADVAIWTNGNVYLNFPVDGFECEDKYDAKFVTHWLGPLPTPEPPQ